jgi:hypothetical protein
VNEFTALHNIYAPGTLALGYTRGSAVAADVVESWGLVVGDGGDVCEGDLDPDAPADVLVPRPDAGANRAAWESYAIANGWKAEDAAVASQEDLEGAGRVAEESDRPADSAKKDAWIDYAVSRGLDRAEADGMTKADLQAWEPQAGDPVALAATEQAQA